jgi:hypothetical protein
VATIQGQHVAFILIPASVFITPPISLRSIPAACVPLHESTENGTADMSSPPPKTAFASGRRGGPVNKTGTGDDVDEWLPLAPPECRNGQRQTGARKGSWSVSKCVRLCVTFAHEKVRFDVFGRVSFCLPTAGRRIRRYEM